MRQVFKKIVQEYLWPQTLLQPMKKRKVVTNTLKGKDKNNHHTLKEIQEKKNLFHDSNVPRIFEDLLNMNFQKWITSMRTIECITQNTIITIN